MPYIADRVQDTTSTVGAGAITLDNLPPAGYQSFATGFGSTCRVQYLIVNGSAWETGVGRFDIIANTIDRAKPQTSSSGNNIAITLVGSSKVYCTVTANFIDNANIGLIYAQSRGFAMP